MGVRILSRQSGVQSTLVPVRSSKGCGAPWIHHALRWKQAKNIFLNLLRPRQGIITCMATKNNKTSGILRDALNEGRSGGKLAHFAAANYLRSIGIDNPPDVARIIDVLTNPNSLFGTRGGSQPINPYARNITVGEMQQVVDFFSQKGFTLPKIIDVVLAFPQVLGYSVPDRLDPFFSYLEQELELSNDEIVTMIDRRPVLLGLQRVNVERLMGYLKENGSSKEEQIRLLETSL